MIQFDTPKTAVFANWLRTKSHLLIGYTSTETGATLITSEALWVPEDQIEGAPKIYAFEGKTECFAINVMKAFITEFQTLQEASEAIPVEQALVEILTELLEPLPLAA